MLFNINNHHTKECGTPPTVDWEAARYRACFENEHHEQWVLWVDVRGIHIAGGDMGWERIITLPVAALRQGEVHVPFVITGSERLWLSACFTAIRGGGMVIAVGVKG